MTTASALESVELTKLLSELGLGENARLSVLAVEILPNQQEASDALGVDLGPERILRDQPADARPDVCV